MKNIFDIEIAIALEAHATCLNLPSSAGLRDKEIEFTAGAMMLYTKQHNV